MVRSDSILCRAAVTIKSVELAVWGSKVLLLIHKNRAQQPSLLYQQTTLLCSECELTAIPAEGKPRQNNIGLKLIREQSPS